MKFSVTVEETLKTKHSEDKTQEIYVDYLGWPM